MAFAVFLVSDLGRSLPAAWRSGKAPSGSRTTAESFSQDLRFGVRSLRRRPLFACLAIITLGLGVGATSAIFSVVDAVLLKPLPYGDPATLVSVWEAFPGMREEGGGAGGGEIWDKIPFTFREYQEVRRSSTSFEDVAVFAGWGGTAITGSGTPEQLSVGLCSGNFFEVLGVQPVLGRSFLPGEAGDSPGTAAQVTIMSHELWQRRFAGDRGILGATINLNDQPFTVVGVLPPGFRLPSTVLTLFVGGGTDLGLRDLWLPLGQAGTNLDGEGNAFEVMARLAEGVTLRQARAETESVLAAVAGESPPQARVAPLKDVVTRGFGTPLYLLLAASGVLLLIACANIATLLMGEATGRREEIGTRMALGADWGRISRQLLTESALLGVLGGGLGVALGVLGTRVLINLSPPTPRLEEVEVSLRVLALTFGAASLTGLLFGLAPITILRRNGIGDAMGKTGSPGGRWDRSRQALMVSLQIALTVVLMVAGGLLTRSLMAASAVDLGFRAEGLATLAVNAPSGRYGSMEEVSEFFQDVVRELEAVPGVTSVGGAQGLPFPGGSPRNGFHIEGRDPEAQVSGRRRTLLTGYHETMGIPVLAGRTFNDEDVPGSPKAIVVSQSLAERFWPEGSPVGSTVRFWGDDPWTIIGVVGDVRHTDLSTQGEPTFYISFSHVPRRDLNLVVRTEEDPAEALPLLRDAIWSVDPEMPITEVNTLAGLVEDSTKEARYRTALIMIFGALATLMAVVGIFGVTARSVAQRTREIGVKMALGANTGSVARGVLLGGLAMGGAGAALGLVAALAVSRLMRSFLFGVGAMDPVVFTSVPILLLLVCLVASLVPALRASRVNPVEALRRP